MFFFGRPNAERLERLRVAAVDASLSYPEVGATGGALPVRGYVVDRNRTTLGRGEAVFAQARQMVLAGKMLHLGWVVPIWPERHVVEGDTVGTLAQVGCGVWCANFCRIVTLADDPHRFSLAYGTLAGHVECGEERFLVEMNPADGTVDYEILAFSHPGRLIAQIGYPYVRRCQRRFARDSLGVMCAAFALGR